MSETRDLVFITMKLKSLNLKAINIMMNGSIKIIWQSNKEIIKSFKRETERQTSSCFDGFWL